MTGKELTEKSIYIIKEYYDNNLQPFFDHVSEDILWIGPADKQELRGRERIIRMVTQIFTIRGFSTHGMRERYRQRADRIHAGRSQ